MDRDVGDLGTELAGAIEYDTGEIEPADIGGEGGVAQHRSHLVTDRLETAGKMLNSIGSNAGGAKDYLRLSWSVRMRRRKRRITRILANVGSRMIT